MATGSPFAGAAAAPPAEAPQGLRQSADLDLMQPARSAQNSEAQLLQRCTAAVEQCRRDLADLRTACKAANSHREKCAELLGAATEAVVALEDMLYDPDIDLQRERSLQALAQRVQQGLDKGEAVVKVYGSMGGLQKLASKICSPGTPLKFDDSIKELTTLAKQARLQRQPAPYRLGASQSTAFDNSVRVPSSVPTMAAQLTPSASNSNQSAALPSSPLGIASGAPSGALSGMGEPGGLGASQQQPSGQAYVIDSREVPEEAMHWKKVRKGGSRQAVTAMVHVPPGKQDQPGQLGYLWYYLSKSVFSNGTLHCHNLSNDVEEEVKDARQDKNVSAMHFDDATGFIWTGHSSGRVRVWDADKREALLEGVKALNHAVSCITTDEQGRCWVGGDRGRVRCFRLERKEGAGVDFGWRLVLRGELNTTGEGIQDPDYDQPEGDGMVSHPLARETAHYGPVRCLAAAAGRVWTCGGSSAFATFREWTQTGIHVEQKSMRSMGLINDMAIVSPVTIVEESQLQRAGAASQALSSFTTNASAAVASRVPTAVKVEIAMEWQLVTAHDSGMVQVWGHVDSQRALQPLVRIGARVAPALRVVVCEPLGALVTAHNDGKVRIRPLQHPRSPSGLKVTHQDKSVSKVGDASMRCAEMDVSRSGLALALGGCVGLVTASNSAAIKLWPVAELRRLAEDAGVVVQSAMAEPASWPVFCFSPWGLQQHLEAQALAAQQSSLDYEASLADEAAHRDRSYAPEHSAALFGEETNKWIIDWTELTRTRIIGEGAFGKVWLGRWQETDVAIKQLGSLSALGVDTGSLQHDSSGGVRLGREVQKVLDKEVGLLKEMRHPNIILFMGVVVEPAAVVTEYCARGSLYDLLQEAREKPALKRALDWPRRIVMALDAAKGMLYLHGHKPAIIHRDLKSPNLLVEKNWRVKVTDFNLSKAATKNDVMSSVQATNPRWQPPEVILRQEYTKASDVYAFGLILWEMLTWDLPFANQSVLQIMLSVTQSHARPPVPDQYAAAQLPGGTFSGYDEYVALMERCWADEPSSRPSFEQVIADLRKVAAILSTSRESGGRPGGLAPSQSRNFARQSAVAMAAAAAASAAANGGAAPAPAPPAQQGAAAQQGAVQGSEGGGMSTQTSAGTSMVAAASGSVISSATPAPSPFDGGPFGGGGGTPPWMQPAALAATAAAGASAVSSASPPPASPFDSPQPAAGVTVSSAAPPPPSPFGDGPAVGQQISSAAPPPPSPFGGAPVGQTISSAAPPPPSPFGDGAAALPPGLPLSSASPPPPSPFGDAGVAAPAPVAAPRGTGRLSPYAACSPKSGSPVATRHPLDTTSMPSTVLEASPSMEEGGLPAASDHKSSGHMSSGRASQLIDSALTADEGRVPRGPSALAAAADEGEAPAKQLSGKGKGGLLRRLSRSMGSSGKRQSAG